MSTQNIGFHGEIRKKYQFLVVKKVPYLELTRQIKLGVKFLFLFLL